MYGTVILACILLTHPLDARCKQRSSKKYSRQAQVYIIVGVVVDGEERGKDFVAGDGEGLGKKISKIFKARDKKDAELALIDTIT